MRHDLRPDESGVTPVIGTVLILGITVTGMALVLFMGTPVLERLQDDAALRTVAGQFEVVRHNVATLSIPETAKSAGLAPSGGNMALSTGDAMMVTVSMDSSYPNCDFRITEWADYDDHVTLGLVGGCRVIAPTLTCSDLADLVLPTALQACIEVYRVSWAALTLVPSTVAVDDITLGQVLDPSYEWVIRLTNGNTNSPVIYAEAWIVPTDRLHWTRASGAGGVEATFELGAVFLRSQNQAYISADPFITERSTDAPAAPPYLLRLPDLEASSYSVISGSDNHGVLIQVSGTYVRVQTEEARRLRYDIAGPLSQAWCQSLLLRNSLNAPPGEYTSSAPAPTDADYGHTCEGGSGPLDATDPTYTVLYTPATSPFPFELSHAALTATLQL